MLSLARIGAAALIGMLFASFAQASASDGQAPRITSAPPLFASLGKPYRYQVMAESAQPGALFHTLRVSPEGMQLDSATGRLVWLPASNQLGSHPVELELSDTAGQRATQAFTLRAVQGFCAIYPITVPDSVILGLQPGEVVEQMPRGTGPGNYSWLTWTGANDAPTVANSLLPPGDSHTYRNPDDADDQVLDIGDWAQGAPGSMNAAAIRRNLDALRGQDIILPAWDDRRGQGSRHDYRVARFVVVRLRDWRLTGNGWISFEYRGEARCYNHAPEALPQSLETLEDTPLPIVLTGEDPEQDSLSYTLLTQPAHGQLQGEPPALSYLPDADYHGEDGFDFRVNDGEFDSWPARISIRVLPVNDPPTADDQQLSTDEDQPVSFVLTGADVDGDALSFRIVELPQHGTLQGAGAEWTYQPDADFHGQDQLRFVSHDGSLDSPLATVSIEVRPLNDPPVAQPQQLITEQDTPLPITLAGTDPDNDTLSFRVVAPPAHGSLGGTPPDLIYQPNAGYHGSDGFDFVVEDGELGSAPARVDITVTRLNRPPQFVSEPIRVAVQGEGYSYPSQAIDPDSDTLQYSIDNAPDALLIDAATGQVAGLVDDRLTQSVRTLNRFCYVIPEEFEELDDEGSVRAPLYQRVRQALTRASDYVAPNTVQWHKRNRCLGCHVQNQGLLGLQGSKDKAEVDEEAAEYLLSEILSSQLADGSIRRSHPQYTKTQTAFALWALSYVPDRQRTLAVRAAALNFLAGKWIRSGGEIRWTVDHNSGWLNNEYAITAVVAQAAARLLDDVEALSDVPAGAQATAELYRQHLPEIAARLVAHARRAESHSYLTALRMLGLGELARHIADPALAIQVEDALAFSDQLLRDRQRDDGGWGYTHNASVSDPLSSALIGFALDQRQPPLSDLAVRRNIEYLLASQRTDGTWYTPSRLYTTNLGTAGAVMAYLPVALQHLGNPDLALGHLRIGELPDTVEVEVMNRGLAASPHTATLRLGVGSDADGELLDEVTVPRLPAGSSRWISLQAAGRGMLEGLYASIQPNAEIGECIEDNNHTQARMVDLRATDPGGLFDTQRYLLNLEDSNSAPRIVSAPQTELAQGLTYDYQVAVDDDDVGDAHEFRLIRAPEGLYISPVTGRLRYALALLPVGSHEVEVEVVDLRGLSDRQQFTLTVIANAPPRILSTPGTEAYLGAEYRYQILAEDDDGDPLLYRLDGAPLTMQLDPASGLLTWTPEIRHLGEQPVQIVVEDGRGGSVTQSYAIQVVSNTPPTFTSTPPPTAQIGQPYVYTASAVDADGDALAFSVVAGPDGLVIDADSGEVDWTPSADTSATVEIELQVDDGRGGRATQSFTVSIEAGGGNRPPVITSTPASTVVEGELYRYLVDASDPDGDVLTVRLVESPTGMTLSEFSGEIRWVPGSDQVGTHPVIVEVDDFAGGIARQSFSVQVTAAVGNRAPRIDSVPASVGKAGREYRYQLVAVDPDGDPLSASLVSAPSGMSLDGSGLIRWTPSSAGSVEARVRVEDGRGAYAEQAWGINVLSADTPLAVQLSVNPDPVDPGADFTLSVQVSGAAGPITLQATLNSQPIALDSSGVTVISAPDQVGRYTLEVSVSDGHDTTTVSRQINVGQLADDTPPQAEIHAPREPEDEDLLIVTAPRPVTISVADDELAHWVLGLVERGDASGSFVQIASGESDVSNAEVGKIDPTLLQNGLYQLVLQAEDLSGNTTQDSVLISVEGAMKVGHFSISFTDLQVPVAGLPITVTRTYDTRQRHKRLDFGYGWNVDYQSLRLQESRRPGFAWELRNYPSGPLGLVPNWCVESALGNVVSVNMPDGEVEKFKAVAYPECNQGVAILDVELRFEPMDGTEGSLKVTNDNFGRLINGSLADPGDPGRPLDPSGYVYTNAEGQEFTLDQGFTVREIFEHEGGNRITFGFNGVVHSAGPSITFVRDAQRRISRVIAPDESEIRYEYDARGDLRAVVDANRGRTEFTYLDGHYLEDIIDPRGVRVARNEYDDDGRLVAVVDADGQRIEYTRDLDGRVEQVRDRNGHTTTYVYNERGDVLAETNAEGETVLRSYDDNGNTLSETDPLGNTRNWTYDWLGNVLTDTDPEGGITRNTFGPFNQHETTTDPLGRVVTDNFYFNQTAGGVPIFPGPLVRIRDANGLSTSFGYSSSTGELTQVTDSSGASTRFELDANGFKTAEIDAEGARTEYLNDVMGRVLEERRTRTLPDGSTEILLTVYSRDAKGNVTAVTHPDGSVTTTEYDGNDKPIRECDALERCTVTAYDNRGSVASITYPDGSAETKTYDANGNLLSQTDRNGATTRFVYDRANRLVETIHPDDTAADDSDNPRSRSVYDDAGRLVQSIDENGAITRYAYDRAGRRVRTELPEVDGVAAVIRDEYDAAGRRIASIDAEGTRTEYVYDPGGRLIETRIDGTSVRTEYDAAGRKSAEVDAENRRTEYAYDRVGRLARVTLGAGTAQATVTTYTHDELGNKLTQTDAEGRTTRWEYDAMGRETARILPGGQREEKAYNAAGELIAHTDFNGQTTRYEYDSAGRLERIDHPNDPDHRFGYDANGQRIEAIDGRGSSRTEYDPRGRVLRSLDADGGQIEYQYDPAGNLIARISPHQSLQYQYDSRNRLIEVTRSIDGEPPSTTRYEYDPHGRRTAMSGGEGTRTEYAYDAKGRLRSLIKRSAAGVLLAAMSYQVDASGLRTGIEESDASGIVRTVAYEYDELKRLTEERIDHRDDAHDRTTGWTYDRVGNRLTQTVAVAAAAPTTTVYTYDPNDRLETETRDGQPTAYTYDANGNTTGKGGPDGLTEYRYDDANRLIEATTPAGTTSYVYNADGLRVRSTHTPTGGSPTTTWYLQDSVYPYAQVIEQHEGDTQASKRITATYAFADELVSQTRYDLGGNPTTAFVQMDGFGSTRWLTDGAGAITDSVDYDAFGVEIGRSGETNVAHLYRGERWDANVAAYDLRARLYTPGNGRFLTQDSFFGFSMDPQSLHKYAFNHNDPINRIDPSGHFSLTEFNTVATIIGIGSMSIHAGFRIAEGDYRGAAEEVARDAVFWALGAGVGRAIVPLSKSAMGLFSRTFMVPLEIVAERSGAVLTRNMEAVMSRVGMTKPPGWQAHHIVGEAYPEGRAAMDILRRFNINVNSPHNGVFLPGCGAKGATDMAGLAVHCGKHVQKYEQYLLGELQVAKSEVDAINILARIRAELMHGDLILNARGNL